jgi:hypothetical protein
MSYEESNSHARPGSRLNSFETLLGSPFPTVSKACSSHFQQHAFLAAETRVKRNDAQIIVASQIYRIALADRPLKPRTESVPGEEISTSKARKVGRRREGARGTPLET